MAHDPAPILIEIENVTKVFVRGKNQITAVDGVQLSLRRGEILALSGPNGAGKSTLIKMIVGLTRPTTGRILIEGADMGGNPGLVGEKIGYLPERDCFYPDLTVREIIGFAGRLKKLPREGVESAVDLVGLYEHMDQKVGSFSKAMRKRLALAQVILGRPPVLVLDEPFAGLDPVAVREERQLIRRLNDEGTSILLSCHFPGVVRAIAHRFASMDRGRLVAVDSREATGREGASTQRMTVELGSKNGRLGAVAVAAGAETAIDRAGKLLVTCRPEIRLVVLQTLQKAGAEVRSFIVEDLSPEKALWQAVAGEEADRRDGPAQCCDRRVQGI